MICLFIVKKNKAKKYNKRIGQNTGTSKILNKDNTIEIETALIADNLQNRKWNKNKLVRTRTELEQSLQYIIIGEKNRKLTKI